MGYANNITPMTTNNFKTSSQGLCRISNLVPDQNAIQMVLTSARKKSREGNLIIIARMAWLNNHKVVTPVGMELPNLFIVIKKGKLHRAFFSSTLTHVIKKQNYYIQMLNGSK